MTTQPQDKMRAEFEAWAKERGYQSDELARCKIGIVSPEYFNLNTENAWNSWQAACAQQSAQASQDAMDAARWRSARSGEDHVKLVNTGGKHNPELWLDIADEQADWAVDAQITIAAQGASNV